MRVNAHLDVSLVRWVLGVLSPSRGEGVQPALWHQVSPVHHPAQVCTPFRSGAGGMLHQELLHTSLSVLLVLHSVINTASIPKKLQVARPRGLSAQASRKVQGNHEARAPPHRKGRVQHAVVWPHVEDAPQTFYDVHTPVQGAGHQNLASAIQLVATSGLEAWSPAHIGSKDRGNCHPNRYSVFWPNDRLSTNERGRRPRVRLPRPPPGCQPRS